MVVTMILVLNVLPTVEARLEVMRGAAARLAPEGALIVATRSTATIRREAARNGWRAWGDGFVSHECRCTFQHGMDAEEIAAWARCSACGPSGLSRRYATRPSWHSHDEPPLSGRVAGYRNPPRPAWWQNVANQIVLGDVGLSKADVRGGPR
jgi:hypothetical protein